MRLQYFVAADTVVIDQLTNRVSILQIVDSVIVADFPCILPGFSTVAGFAVLPEVPAMQRQAILRVSGSALPETQELPSSFRSDGTHHRLVYRLEHVALQGEGEIDLDLFINGIHLGKHTLSVRQAPRGDDRSSMPPA